MARILALPILHIARSSLSTGSQAKKTRALRCGSAQQRRRCCNVAIGWRQCQRERQKDEMSLLKAIEIDNLNIAEMLLKNGADVHPDQHGTLPLCTRDLAAAQR
jgi:hypothetical protein